jgi:hypothetical protein
MIPNLQILHCLAPCKREFVLAEIERGEVSYGSHTQ